MTSVDLSLFATLVLIALVDAMSPVRVAVILLLLSGTRPVLRGLAFILGVGTLNLVLAFIITLFVDALPTIDFEVGPLGLMIGLLLGIGLLIFAIRTWRTQPAKTESEQPAEFKMPAFLSRFSDTMLKGNISIVFAGGMVMQLFSLKSLILFGIALKEVISAGLSPSRTLVAILFFIILDLIEMIIPTAMFAASPDNSARLLNQMTQWLLHYSYPILAVAEGALAIYLIIESVTGLLT
jgi:hypothetical protein